MEEPSTKGSSGTERFLGADARKLARKLGASSPSCVDGFGRKIHRKRRIPWRPKVVNYAMLVTDWTRYRPGVFSNRGSTPIMSISGFQETERDAPRHLPISFYDSQWYSSLSPYKRQLLGAREDKDCSWIFAEFRKAQESSRL